jgi:flavin reductase (DIM6/NTAB) family NADH-FMN oxidoreductase RutF
MLLDYNDAAPSTRYKLMSQTIIPRPIAWVVTEYEGVVNLAPFSYFTGLSSDPATLLISVGHKSDGSQKDTLRNIRASGKCTVCMVNEPLLEKMHQSSKELDASISEAEAFGIGMNRPLEAFPPMVTGTPAAFFCEFYQEVDLKGSKTIPIVVEIKQQFVDEGSITDREKLKIDYAPVARVGNAYALLDEAVDAPKMPE